MKSLNEFATYQEVFKIPDTLPPFFDQNLVDQSRVVKVFINDPQAHIRIFYYQYLKICFQINHPNSESLVRKIEELINNPTFQFIFFQEDDPSIFNDTQAKKFISDFFQQLSSGRYTILQAISVYPIMDIIMVHLFRTLMILMDKAQSLDNYISRDDVLSFLCHFFSIEVELHDDCIKYVDTDIFVYDLNQTTVYMAFINYTELSQSTGPAHHTEHVQPHHVANVQPAAVSKNAVSNVVPQAPKPAENHPLNQGVIKESYIASEFFDYTQDDNIGKLADKGTTLKGSEHDIQPVYDIHQASIPPYTGTSSHVAQQQNTYAPSNINGSNYKSPQQTTLNYNQPYYGQSEYSTKTTLSEINAPKSAPSHVPLISQPPQPVSPPKQVTPTYQPPSQQTIPANQYSNVTQTNQYVSPPSKISNPVITPISPPKAQAPYDVSEKKDLFYNQKVEAPFVVTKIETPAYVAPSTRYASSDVKSNTQHGSNLTTSGVSKKKNFGINVSEEFTSSQTMKCMSEPFKSNVHNIKSRVRTFRSNLANFIK